MINKMDKVLVNSLTKKQSTIECIIYVKNINTDKKILERQKNLIITGEFPFISALSIKTKSKNLNKIAVLPFVQYISSQTQVFALMNIAKKIINVDKKLTGNDITIAYIDTGISTHMDFMIGKKRIIKFVDLINNYEIPYDDNGHGTFICGVGSGNGCISNGKFSGICPNSNIISIKALNSEGEANATKILEAMQWIYNNYKKYKIKVVCMSFGSEPLGINDPIMKGAEILWNNGITVVAAAGNSGPSYSTIKSPGISKKIITVGGFDDNRDNGIYNPNFFEIANFSSRGPALNNFKPDVIAPAVDITSCSNSIEKFYTNLSGTSVATPMVAGLCALYLEQNPNLRPSEIKKIITKNCKPITFNKNKEGYGYIIFKSL